MKLTAIQKTSSADKKARKSSIKTPRNKTILKKNRKKVGRKTLYQPSVHPKLVGILSSLNWTDTNIISYLSISRDTFYAWLKNKTDFADAYNKGKKNKKVQVEGAMLRLALGTTTTKKIFKDINKKEVRTVEEIECPPNISAIKYFLQNKYPEEWGDTSSDVNINFSDDFLSNIYNRKK